MRYRSPQYIKSWDIGIASDGGMLMTGYFGMGIQVEPLLAKLKKNGDVAWAQTLNNYMHTGLFKKVLRTADGNNLLLGVDNFTISHGSGDSSILMKINDNTGEVIWARYCKGDIYNITETDDGGFVFCLNENYGFPPIGTYLARIDGNGNIMWQRRIGTDIGGAAVYRGIVYDQSNIYLAADYYNAHPASSLLLERWDATTGTRIWEQRFLIPGEEFYLESLSKIGDTLFTGININTTSFPFTLNFGVFKASINGAGLGGFKFTVPDVSLFPVYNYSYFNEHLVSRFTSTSDDKFVFADQCVVNGDTLLQIRKFTTTGDVLWSRKYPNIKKSYVTAIKELDNKLLIFGRTQKGIIDNTIATDAFLMKTDSIGKVNDATTGDCYSEPSGASTEELPPFQIIPLTPATPVSPGTIVFRDYSPYKRPVNIWAEVACNIPSACNNIVTTGPVTICNTADTVVYSALRNPGCISAVNWVVDTARVKIVSSTDTSIRVYFTGYGNTQIKARLVAGCSFKTDAINVSVVRNADSLNLGPDVDVCPSTPVTLFAGSGYKNYTWQDGSTSTSHAALAPGIYYVDAEDSCGRIKRDSVTVTWFTPALMTAGPDKIKCNADTIHLAATMGLTGYTWTPAYNIQTPQSSMIVASPLVDTTYYVLAVDHNGCNVYDTIRVKVNQSPPIDLGTDKSFCAGDSAVLDAGPSFQGYAWSNGSTSQTITVRASGLYNVVGTASNGCHSSDTLAIDKVFALPSGFLNPETLFCVKDSAELKSTRAYSSYLWNTGATTQSIYVRQSGMYWLEATDNNGCKAKEFIEAKQQQCIQGVYFPSAFTPDNNGRNDFFKPLVYERVTNYTFSIYNRWGQLVFTTRNTTAGWDGKLGGVPQDANVFVWVCTYQPEGSKSLREVKGTFVLIR
jgi:gliding motility-associated-like protein